MKVFFDTSVLVTAVVDQLSNHEAAMDCFLKYSSGSHQGFCSTHALAECYSTLTALPVPVRIQPSEAERLIHENFVDRLEVLEVKRTAYITAIRRVSEKSLVSGVIYDALHLSCAESTQCKRLYTYNLSDFERLEPLGILITAP
ncbi:MAG: PIN domain-containing protein [Planctomycetota bacterium]|nr:PIN domain-containing protein [Planctomycetota bacterium]MDA1143208.1 PIN domain-containing protein [Planctomycetota bacterium]